MSSNVGHPKQCKNDSGKYGHKSIICFFKFLNLKKYKHNIYI